jgi:hypothetical protein
MVTSSMCEMVESGTLPDGRTGWSELFPEGRCILDEGDDTEGFAADVRTKFGFDPSADASWAQPSLAPPCT